MPQKTWWKEHQHDAQLQQPAAPEEKERREEPAPGSSPVAPLMYRQSTAHPWTIQRARR